MRFIPQMIASQRGVSPPDAFLVLPKSGSREFALLARKVRLLATRALLTADFATPLSPAIGRALETIQPSITGILQRSPDEFLAAVGSPDVLPFLLGAHCGSIAADQGVSRAVPNLLGELHVMGVRTENLTWPVSVHSVVTRAGMWSFAQPARWLAVTASEICAETDDGKLLTLDSTSAANARLPLNRFPGSLHFALHDTNPLSLQEAHPDKSGNALDLGGRSAQEWIHALDEALALIEAGIPEWYAELPVALHRIVPVGFEPERHFSASYREAPGVLYMTLHPDPLTLAEAIVHETQHTKLNSLTWLDPVLLNGQSHWTASPIRPDLRPLMGVLMAVHAFVPVAAMHYVLAGRDHRITESPRFRVRREEVLSTNAAGLETLHREAEPTEVGASLIDSLSRLHKFLSEAPR